MPATFTRAALTAACVAIALAACKPVGPLKDVPAYPSDVKGTVASARIWQTGVGSKRRSHYELTVNTGRQTTKVTVSEAVYRACKAKGSKLPGCLPVYDDI